MNVSIFDRNYIEALFGGVEYPDGSFVIDNVEELITHQKIFMEVVSQIRSENMFTFPVLTYSLLYKNGHFIDEEFARWCSDHNTIWNDSNFFVSGDVNTLSNCCFSGDQLVLARSSNGIYHMPIRDIANIPVADRPDFAIFHNGGWAAGTPVRLHARKMYRVTTANHKDIYVTDNHINVTLDGEKETRHLTTDDYLMFNTSALHAIPERDMHLTYEMGYLIGMYLGDGNYNSVEANLPPDKVDEFIKTWVLGEKSETKELNMECMTQSYDFREGILGGYYLTNGGVNNCIYSVSKNLIYQMEAVITSLGMNSVIDVSDRLDEELVIRWYDDDSGYTEENVFIRRNNSTYFKIVDISPVDYDDQYVYCFEMDREDEPYFTLPNGLITHNCRLLSDTSKLNAFINSIGGTALSIGSVKVNTMNLMRIAYETYEKDGWFLGNDEKKARMNEYLRNLRETTVLCCKALDRVRHIIKRNVDKGLLPNYVDGGVELSKQYCTIGILGLYEVIRYFGMTETDEFGNISYTDEGIDFASRIFDVINDVKDNFGCDYSFNIESVPAERAAIILCQKDKLYYGMKDSEDFIYSNQWIPLTAKCTIQEKLRVCSILDNKCSGGSIAHINLENNFPNTDMAWNVLNNIAKSGVIYFAFNTRINECVNHHGFVGTEICPVCGEGVHDTYQRIVGYLVPTRAYSKDRKKEFSIRNWYDYAEGLSGVIK